MKKISCIIFALVLILTGCNSKKESSKNIVEGKIQEISLQEWEAKMNNKDDFLVLFSQLHCIGCNDFHKMINPYLKKHNIILYEVILDYEEGDPVENQDRINSYLQDFYQTPGIYYIEDGKKKDEMKPEDAVLEEKFSSFVDTYSLDKNK